jgi:Na+-translocating ferredoxin:NAD+ oxidoreductase subunit B
MSTIEDAIVDRIDRLLPQTQCQLCDYPGCLPYAKAIANGEADIDRCAPGGVITLNALAALLQKDPTPFQQQVAANTKPHQVVKIRANECIGCLKCLQVCPVDAIVGSIKLMHTVITQDCTGCELCIEPCPMDCIDIIPAPAHHPHPLTQAEQSRVRYRRRQQRQQEKIITITINDDLEKTQARQDYIREALARVQAKQHARKTDE